MNIKTIAIGSDHAGFLYKESVLKLLTKKGISVIDNGPLSDASVDYPDHVHPVATAVTSGMAELGIVLCGSGNGVAMTVNKHQDIRAGLCWTAELAQLTRQHNDANILAIPARFVSEEVALDMIEAFISTAFEGGRHQRRVDKIACC